MEIINQDLTKFSTIRTKSFAKYYCEPKTISELKEAIEFKNSKKQNSNNVIDFTNYKKN